MTPELWQRVCGVFERAAALEPPRRAEYLREQDGEVAEAVAAMLQQQEARPQLDSVPRSAWQLLDDGSGGERRDKTEWPAQIGPYEVHDKVGAGGMGIVLRVTDHKFDRHLALKILAVRHRHEGSLARRFRDEARLMGRLQHPGIPPVHDRGELPDGRPYIVMKLIKGQTLSQLLHRRPAGDDAYATVVTPAPATGTEIARLLPVFEQICHTLAYAHGRGVIHRDLKPANIMVGAHGEVQVMDWGLAKVLRAHDTPDARADDTPPCAPALPSTAFIPANTDAGDVTVAGAIVGTPAYMSPEQARGEVAALDERCDVFGLGAILCEILTGQPPFAGEERGATIRRARSGDLTPAFARLDVCGADAELIALAKRCLAPKPEQRPRHAEAVAEAVVRYQAALQQRVHDAQVEQAAAGVRRRARRWATAAAVGALVVAIVAAAWIYVEREQRELAGRLHLLEQQVASALDDEQQAAKELDAQLGDPRQAHTLISDPSVWQRRLDQRRARLDQAKALAAGGLLAAPLAERLQQEATRYEADLERFALARALDDIHLESFAFVEDQWDPTPAVPKYAAFFADRLKLDVAAGDPAALAQQIAGSPLRWVLVAALDHWLEISSHPASKDQRQVPRLLEIARRADPDPWRDHFRQEKAWNDLRLLEPLATELSGSAAAARLANQAPHVLTALASRLERFGGNGLAVLDAALVAYPRDFWLNLTTANVLKQFAQKAGYYQAALAVRPTSSVAWTNQGVALFNQHKLDEALAAYRRAAAVNDKDWNPYRLMGKIYVYQARYPEAEQATAQALALLAANHPFHARVAQQLDECRACLAVQAREKTQPVLSAEAAAVIDSQLSPDDPRDILLPRRSFRKSHAVRLLGQRHYLIDVTSTAVAAARRFDPILRIESESWQPLLRNDDINPEDRSARLVFTPDETGVYRLVVNSYEEAKAGEYQVRIREAVEVAKPEMLRGELRRSDKSIDGRFTSEHKVSLSPEIMYVFELSSKRFDTFLRLLDEKGTQLAFNDDVAPTRIDASRLDFTPARAGNYIVQVTSYLSGETGPFTVTIRRFKPVRAVTAAIEYWSAQSGAVPYERDKAGGNDSTP